MQSINSVIQVLQIPPKLRNSQDINSLLENTSEINFFKKIRDEEKTNEIHRACCQVMHLESYKAGSNIINFGEKGDKFYILLRGRVGVLLPTKKAVVLNPSEIKQIRNSREQKSTLPTLKSDSEESEDEEELFITPKNKQRRKGKFLTKEVVKVLESYRQKEIKSNEEHMTSIEQQESKISQIFQNELERERQMVMEMAKNYEGSESVEIELEQLQEVAELKAGAHFGEFALLSDKPRAATIRAKENCLLAVLKKSDFRRILGSISEKKVNEKIEFLYSLSYFKNWTRIAVHKLSYNFKSLVLSKNQCLYKEGDKVKNVYFVKNGEFKISKQVTEKRNVINNPSCNGSLEQKIKNFSFMKLRNIRQKNFTKEIQLVIKGKNEILGGEEVVQDLEHRQQSCVSLSNFSEVLYISKENFMSSFSYHNTKEMLCKRLEFESARLKVKQERQLIIEDAKNSLDFSGQPKKERSLPKKPNYSRQIQDKVSTPVSKPSSLDFDKSFSAKRQQVSASLEGKPIKRSKTPAKPHGLKSPARTGSPSKLIIKKLSPKREAPQNFLYFRRRAFERIQESVSRTKSYNESFGHWEAKTRSNQSYQV